jgi:hypothetical protein
VDAEENQRQVSHGRPQSLEIAKAAIPTFPQLRRGAEKWKTKSRFPTFPLAIFSSPKTNPKGGLAADRFAPAFRLILRLENADNPAFSDQIVQF